MQTAQPSICPWQRQGCRSPQEAGEGLGGLGGTPSSPADPEDVRLPLCMQTHPMRWQLGSGTALEHQRACREGWPGWGRAGPQGGHHHCLIPLSKTATSICPCPLTDGQATPKGSGKGGKQLWCKNTKVKVPCTYLGVLSTSW